ncbi:zinc ribbon domain-containing protein [Rugamonas rivuli]|uniref:Uncharacterized protein n=1 Tax=Rugamonas rivuli TaxID=2743358 RepID=A0A843SEP7_9BURK|nr:zinc ribbon domain-containing protein [Rugamonas rivuli]MQA20630.1 hypothetical protein [Rugamonas rivuli]
MAFCRYCGKPIPDAAPTCSHCGGVQAVQSQSARAGKSKLNFTPVSTLFCVLASLVLYLSEESVDQDMINFLIGIAAIGIVCGIICVKIEEKKDRAANIVFILASILLLITALARGA